MECSETARDKDAQRNRLREIFGVFFGTPGRSAATSAAAVVLVIVGYVILLPSGLFDDSEFVPTPWEEWGIPGDPPTERPLITEWFDQSPTWQEAERLSAMPGVEEAVNRLAEDDDLSEEDFAKALALLQARGEAGIELTRVASNYSLGLLSEPSDDDYLRANRPVREVAWTLYQLTSISLTGERTGREAEEWLEHFGEFVVSVMPLGESSLINNLSVHWTAGRFFDCALEWIPRQGGYESNVVVNLREQVATLEQGSFDGIMRAFYGEAQYSRHWLDERVGPGRAWTDRGELGMYFDLSADFPNWLGWLEVPANWWMLARVQQNMTKAVIEERYRDSAQWLQLPPSERLTLDARNAPGWREFLDPRPNAIGERILASYVPETIQRTGRQMLATQTAATMVDIALAIAQWQAAGGGPGLPATLDELVPEFLDGIPIDPFSGRPFGYAAVRGVLWSVGMDGVDTGGKRPEEHRALTSELREGRSGTLDLWHVFQIEPDGGAEETE